MSLTNAFANTVSGIAALVGVSATEPALGPKDHTADGLSVQATQEGKAQHVFGKSPTEYANVVLTQIHAGNNDAARQAISEAPKATDKQTFSLGMTTSTLKALAGERGKELPALNRCFDESVNSVATHAGGVGHTIGEEAFAEHKKAAAAACRSKFGPGGP